MTREETIRKVLDKVLWTGNASDDNKRILTNALIEALEQEHCEDYISRQAVLDHIYGVNGLEGLELSNVFEKHYADFIKSLPPVTPKPKTDVLDKIRDEIKEESKFHPLSEIEVLEHVLEIIDECAKESDEERGAER